MAFDDMFREKVSLDPDETFEVCRIRKRSEIFDLAGFGEPMMAWQKKIEKLGGTVVPRQVYTVNIFEQYEHRVAWVYRSQPHDDYIEDYHHIACDCLAEMENPQNEIEEIAGCPAVIGALDHRARRVSKVLGNQGIFDFYGKPEGTVAPKNHSITIIKSLVNFLMNYEHNHPEGWVANTVSGEHQVPLLATIMQIQPYPDTEHENQLSMQEVVEVMHEEGSLLLHEDASTISLPKAA